MKKKPKRIIVKEDMITLLLQQVTKMLVMITERLDKHEQWIIENDIDITKIYKTLKRCINAK